MRRRPFLFFFGLYLNLGAKFRNKTELLSLTKLRKNILHPRNLLNEQKIDAYATKHQLTYQTILQQFFLTS